MDEHMLDRTEGATLGTGAMKVYLTGVGRDPGLTPYRDAAAVAAIALLLLRSTPVKD